MCACTRLTTAFTLALIVAAAAACGGGGGSPTTPSTNTTTTSTTTTTTPAPVPTTSVKYEGTFASLAYVGSFTISAEIPTSLRSVATATTNNVTCTYHFGGAAATNTISGTYDSTTKTFVCANAAISLTATIQSDNTVTGTTKGGNTPEGAMAGAATTTTTSALNLCGTFTGGDSNGGRISITQTGTKIVGVAYDNGTNSKSVLSGTIVGPLVKISWPLENGNSGSATGALTAGANTYFINGDWTNTFGEKGKWTVSASSC